jgi:hypothetical protein
MQEHFQILIGIVQICCFSTTRNKTKIGIIERLVYYQPAWTLVGCYGIYDINKQEEKKRLYSKRIEVLGLLIQLLNLFLK